eukprot:CAMPEP_0118967176 /NCGR_PEP_ID=MMETSP1173-20130426/4600_1 /TAXON_ID=1034831 /ORGANISM="Rhizochromulina marina cf, Strain CCMP1243" /LENGTH=102 /DNA_ID=CAMNT_0006916091 /DNA_START=65 /DNA_END=369 /DNA_ORIENTATION=-
MVLPWQVHPLWDGLVCYVPHWEVPVQYPELALGPAAAGLEHARPREKHRVACSSADLNHLKPAEGRDVGRSGSESLCLDLCGSEAQLPSGVVPPGVHPALRR